MNGKVTLNEPDWWNMVPASFPRPDGINEPTNLTAKDLWQRWLDLDRWAGEHRL